MMKATNHPRAQACTIYEGRIHSIHGSMSAARSACPTGGKVLAIEKDAFGRRPNMALGDLAADFGGQVLPR
jgi:hypothetical protein